MSDRIEDEVSKVEAFESDLRALVNWHGMEGVAGNTPDHVIAAYLVECLHTLGHAVAHRDALLNQQIVGIGENIYRLPGAPHPLSQALPGDNIKEAG